MDLEIEEKLGGHTKKEWREMVANHIIEPSDEVLEFIKLNIFEKKLMETPKMPPPPPGAVKEIEIFTVEQLNILPEEARVSIINLESNLPQKELLILNPLVSELLKIQKLTKIKYVPLPEEPTKEDIAAHKENIQEFKDAKKAITALTQQNSAAKSAIKGPLDLLGKQVLTIEKSVKKIADEVLATIELTFKPFIDAEAKKAQDAKDKKEAKEKEAINKLTEQNTAQSNLLKKSTLTTFLKYEMLEETKTEVNNAIENYTLDKLFSVRDMLSLKTFDHFTKEKDLTLLDEEELTNIKVSFQKEIELFKTNINTKITALQLEKDNEKLSDTVEQQAEQLSAPLPPPPAPPVPVGTPISNTDVFDVISNGGGQVFGAGANRTNVPIELYPSNPKEVDFLDLVIEQINTCKDNIAYIRKRFTEDSNIVKSEEDAQNIERVRGAGFLLDKTTLYILNQLPPAEPKK